MATPPLQKNGDTALSREIRDLRHDFEIRWKEDAADHRSLMESHRAMLEKITNLTLEQRTYGVKQDERLASDTTIRRQVFALLLLFLTSIGGVIAWAEGQLNHLQDDISEQSAFFSAFEAKGRKWGEQLDQKDAEQQRTLRDLRRRVNEHHSLRSHGDPSRSNNHYEAEE